jgi:pilus assembly protein CpaC
MSWSMIKRAAAAMMAVALVAACAIPARADGDEKLLIPVGHAQVVISDGPVKTVAIAEPKIADAAVGSERTVIVNAKTAGTTSLVVYGDAGRFRVYEIEVFTPNADKQVSLHVKVAEVNATAKKELGFDFSASGQLRNPGHTDFLSGGLFTTKVSSPTIPLGVGPSTDGAIGFSRDGGLVDLRTTWRALEEAGDIRVLASPTLVSMSGEKATFLAGGELPIPIASSGGGNFINVTIEWKEFGVKVEFTPTVKADGSIDLVVAPEVSSLDFTNPLTLSGFIVPIVATRKTATTVNLAPGENLVISGLKQTDRNKKVSKIPILGDIPILGFFFTNTKTEDVERELMVVVSPEMIEAATKMPKLPTDQPMK